MTTNLSGEYRLDLTANQIIIESLDLLQVVGDGEGLDGEDFNRAARSLNMMLKLWETQGIHLWMDTEYTLFFTLGQSVYDLTSAAVHVSSRQGTARTFDSTDLAADALALADTIEVDDDSLITLGQNIGILLDTQDLFWTVVERLPGANMVQLRVALPTAASAGRVVRTFSTANLGTTELAGVVVATDVILSVDTVQGIEPDYQIGIELDTGDVFWSTVNSIDAGADTVTIDDQMPSGAAIDNDVIFYSSTINFIPFNRIPDVYAGVRRHAGEASDYEIPIVFQSRQDYMNLPNKQQRGTVIQAYYSRQEPAGQFFLWNTPSSALEYMNFTAERQIQIITGPDDTFDLPGEWYDALTYNLAVRLIPKFGCSAGRKLMLLGDGTPQNPGMAETYLNNALGFDQAVYPIRLKPQKYG